MAMDKKKPAAKKPAAKKPWSGSKADEKADAEVMKGMNPIERAKFRAGDKKMDKKKPGEAADKKMDKKLARDVKKKY